MRSTRSSQGPNRCSTTTVVRPRARTTSPTTWRTDAALARVEHRGGLVEQQDPRRHGQRPGQRQPLLLASGEAERAGAREVTQPDLVQRGGDRRGHRVPRHTEVLEPERHVPLDRRGDHGGARVLEHQADRPGGATGCHAVDEHGAGEVAGVGRQQEPGDRPEHRRLARTARPDQQHPLPRGDPQGEVGEHRPGPAVGTPGQSLDLDRGARVGGQGRRCDAEGVRQSAPPALLGPAAGTRALPPSPAPSSRASRARRR